MVGAGGTGGRRVVRRGECLLGVRNHILVLADALVVRVGVLSSLLVSHTRGVVVVDLALGLEGVWLELGPSGVVRIAPRVVLDRVVGRARGDSCEQNNNKVSRCPRKDTIEWSL